MRKCECKYNDVCLAVRQDRQAKLRDETGKSVEECAAYKVRSGLENKEKEGKEKNKKVLMLDIKGIQCDNPKCDYLNEEVSIEDYEKWINNLDESLIRVKEMIEEKDEKRRDNNES